MKKSEKIFPLLARINVIRTHDNHILIDIEHLESIINNQIISIIEGRDVTCDRTTLLKFKKLLNDICDTTIARISEQEESTSKYVPGTIKNITIDYSKIF